MLEKYVEKYERYKQFVNEETERAEEKVIEISNEIKSREEFRKNLKVVIPNERYKHFVDEEE
jgi:hypothetical protein